MWGARVDDDGGRAAGFAGAHVLASFAGAVERLLFAVDGDFLDFSPHEGELLFEWDGTEAAAGASFVDVGRRGEVRCWLFGFTAVLEAVGEVDPECALARGWTALLVALFLEEEAEELLAL